MTLSSLPKIACISTLHSRVPSLEAMLPTIVNQVDAIHVYLDGHQSIPPCLQGLTNAEVFSGQSLQGLKSESRFLSLAKLGQRSLIFMVDDDILYPDDYVERLTRLLSLLTGRAIVGVQGRIFLPPHRSYVRDALFLHFESRVAAPRQVHEIGTGTCAFVSGQVDFDPHGKPLGMSDIVIAVEAQRKRMPRVAIDREQGWLKAISQAQGDSIWMRTIADHKEQDKLMRQLLALYDEPGLSREADQAGL